MMYLANPPQRSSGNRNLGRKCKRRKPCGFRLLHAVKRLFFGGRLAAGLCLYLLGESFGVR